MHWRHIITLRLSVRTPETKSLWVNILWLDLDWWSVAKIWFLKKTIPWITPIINLLLHILTDWQFTGSCIRNFNTSIVSFKVSPLAGVNNPKMNKYLPQSYFKWFTHQSCHFRLRLFITVRETPRVAFRPFKNLCSLAKSENFCDRKISITRSDYFRPRSCENGIFTPTAFLQLSMRKIQ